MSARMNHQPEQRNGGIDHANQPSECAKHNHAEILIAEESPVVHCCDCSHYPMAFSSEILQKWTLVSLTTAGCRNLSFVSRLITVTSFFSMLSLASRWAWLRCRWRWPSPLLQG